MAIVANLLGTNFNIQVHPRAPISIIIQATTATATYEANYQNGKLNLSIPEVALVNLAINNGRVAGTIKLNGIADITINEMVMTSNFMITSLRMTANVSGFEFAIQAQMDGNMVDYRITSDLGAGLTFGLEGSSGGAIGDLYDVTTYEIESECTMAVTSSYITQEIKSSVILSGGDLELGFGLNTVMVKGQMELATEGLTLLNLRLSNVMLNTRIEETDLYVNTGFNYVMNTAFQVYQTMVKLDNDNVFLIGGGNEVPIDVNLATRTIEPNRNLVVKIGSIRIVTVYQSATEFRITADPYVDISRNGKRVKVQAALYGYNGVTMITIRQNVIDQKIQVSKAEFKIV
mgnify:CR=1 FL=1